MERQWGPGCLCVWKSGSDVLETLLQLQHATTQFADRGLLLALAAHRRLLEILAAADLGGNAGLLTFLLEALEGAINGFAFFKDDSGHEKRFTCLSGPVGQWGAGQRHP